MYCCFFFFFKQKTAYDMRISDWRSDVCSSDLKMPKQDIFVGILVAVITVWLHNLALAVLIGVIISALVFAWESAKRIRARKYVDHDGVKHYEIYRPLFLDRKSVV